MISNKFRIIEIQEIVINMCYEIKVQNFKRISINLKVRKGVHRKPTIFNSKYIKILYIEIYQQREVLVHS